MKIKAKYLIIGATLIIAALAYYTDSPILGAALCAGLISGHFGIMLGATMVLYKLSKRLPTEVLNALLSGDCEVSTIEKTIDPEDRDKIDQAVKEFHEMLDERERKAKSGE